MQYQYKILKSEEVYRGFFRVMRYQVCYEQFRGDFSLPLWRECLGTGNFVVAALPFDPVREEFIFVEQFRIGAMVAGKHPWQWELVAGFMDKTGETAEESIRRELLEETGLIPSRLQHVMTYLSSPGGSAGQTHLFFAEIDANKVLTHTGLSEEGEDILVHRVSYQKARQIFSEGKLNNANTLLALQAFLLQNPKWQISV